MSSDEGAKNLLKEAKEIANCNPDEYYRDFLLTRSSDNNTTNETQKVGFHSNILTELNITLTEQLQSFLTDLESKDEIDRKILSYDVDNFNHDPTPIQYVDESDIPESVVINNIINRLTINNVTDFTNTDDIKFQSFRIKIILPLSSSHSEFSLKDR